MSTHHCSAPRDPVRDAASVPGGSTPAPRCSRGTCLSGSRGLRSPGRFPQRDRPAGLRLEQVPSPRSRPAGAGRAHQAPGGNRGTGSRCWEGPMDRTWSSQQDKRCQELSGQLMLGSSRPGGGGSGTQGVWPQRGRLTTAWSSGAEPEDRGGRREGGHCGHRRPGPRSRPRRPRPPFGQTRRTPLPARTLLVAALP